MPIPALQWGLAGAVPPDATSAWGCRAIVTQDGYIDLVPDRTGQQGTPLSTACSTRSSRWPS
jgi:hypothetical protein